MNSNNVFIVHCSQYQHFSSPRQTANWPRYQRKTNRNTFEYVSLPMVSRYQNQTMVILLHIIDWWSEAVLITFQDDQWGGHFFSSAGENTGIVAGILCDGALDTQGRHHGVSRPVGMNPVMAKSSISVYSSYSRRGVSRQNLGGNFVIFGTFWGKNKLSAVSYEAKYSLFVWSEVLKSNAEESFKKLKWLGCFTPSDLPSFLPFPIFERECAVVEFPQEDVVGEGLDVPRGEEGVGGGGVGGGQTGVEVDTLHVEITARTVHQSSTGVADLQHRPCQRQWGEMTSPLYQLVCIVAGI